MNSFWAYSYFHIPNFILAALMYTVLGRMALSIMVPANWDNYIFKAFVRLTDPVVRFVRAITPQVLTEPVVLVFSFLWLLALRFAFAATLFKLGLLPTAG